MAVTYCPICHLNFSTQNGLRNHIANKLDHQRYCWPCRRWFVNDTAIAQHETSDAHRAAEEQEAYVSEQESYSLDGQANIVVQQRAYTAAQQVSFFCKPCNRSFINDEALQQHLSHSGEHVYCTKCRRDFVSSEARDSHFVNSNRHNICPNKTCQAQYDNGADFDHPDLLLRHYEKELRHRFRCRHCKNEFSSDVQLRQHFAKTNSVCHYCTLCSKEYASRSELLNHYTASSIHYFCIKCNQHFGSGEELLTHIKSNSKHFYCEKCTMDFQSDYIRHTHWELTSGHYICKSCNKDFPSDEQWHQHMESNSHYFCSKCSEEFASDEARLLHMKTNSSHHLCVKCNVDFLSDKKRTEHLEYSNLHYFCIKCQTEFASKYVLKQHFEDSPVHFFCTKCSKNFASDVERTKHFLNADAHHWCHKCERDFDSEEARITHCILSPYHNKCRSCDADFATPTELSQHRTIHQPRVLACACSMQFPSLLAIILHWEKGKCITNARELDQLVLRFDEHEKIVVLVLKGHLKGTHVRICSANQSHLDRRSKNYICPFDDYGEAFDVLEALNRHLVGSFHEVEVFRCPGATCNLHLSSLGGLVQHVESTTCPEGIEIGTGCLGRLGKFLMKELDLSAEAPTSEDALDSLL